jgi:uncharacterized cupredoxin-like copper-binding protein
MINRLQGRRALPLLTALLVTTVGTFALREVRADASSTQFLHLSAKPHMVLRFNTNHLHAHTGRIMIVMHNPKDSGMHHGIAIKGHGIKKVGPIVAPGHTAAVTVTITRKGNYEFYCPVPGHAQAGMRGTLTVS